MAQKPSIPKGTRDFSPQEMAKRNYIFDTIKSVFLLYGFQPIETPAMENLSTLMGKYGEEGDKLLFKILNSGDYLKNAPDELLANKDYIHLITKLSEKGLRYDLTVPFARYVVQHREELQLPFKRYQIQPVWRADRPQRGRYREFYQCDADVVGSDSLFNEVELISIIDEVFKRFGINIVIKLNNRKVLTGIAEVIGAPEKIVDITVAIDKMDKIGLDNVNAELAEKGLSQQAIDTLRPLLTLSGTNQEKIATLEQLLATSQVGLKGIEEIKFVLLGSRLLMAVILTEAGTIKETIIKFDEDISQDQVDTLTLIFNNQLRGKALSTIDAPLEQYIMDEVNYRIDVIKPVIEQINKALNQESKFYLNGANKALDNPELKTAENAKKFLEILEEKNLISDLLDKDNGLDLCNGDVKVYIGNEINGLNGFSLITFKNTLNGKNIGNIGIIGPTRMDYSKVISVLNYIKNRLNGK